MCRVIGATRMPRATSSVISSAREGAAGARPSRRCRARPRRRSGTRRAASARDVAVADRLPVARQVVLERLRQVETGEPQAERRHRARGSGPAAAGQLELLADSDASERCVPAAQLDDPEAVGSWSRARRREPQLEPLAVRRRRRDGGRKRRGGVDDDQVAGREEPGRSRKRRVDDRAVRGGSRRAGARRRAGRPRASGGSWASSARPQVGASALHAATSTSSRAR